MSAIDESQESATGEESAGKGSVQAFSPGRIGSSLRYRNYRLFFFGQLVSVMGTWMQTVAQSFLVLDLTHSGTDLGLVTAARFLPILLFGQAGGLFADRRNKRRILYVTQALSGLLAAIFAILTGTHVIQMWLVYVLALSLGLVERVRQPGQAELHLRDGPARRAPNAVTLNSVSINLARVFGAALGGVLTAVLGLALCFACNAISFVAVIASLAAMNGGAALPGQAGEADARPDQAGPALRPRDPELLHPAPDDRAGRHPGLGVPGDAAADGQQGVRRRRWLVRRDGIGHGRRGGRSAG